MPPKDDSSGIFSKVVKFVQNKTTNWGELEQESERESSYSKQMLKEMIERKRRNDFVRKREFDMLRKMRRSEVLAGQDPGARPSFFQSSMPSKPDDRATTLKKIDEIEAQMSMQWWKTKHGEGSSSRLNANSTGSFMASSHIPPEHMRTGGHVVPPPPSAGYTRTEPQPLAPAQVPTMAVPLDPLVEEITLDPSRDVTHAMELDVPLSRPAAPAPPPPPAPRAPAPQALPPVNFMPPPPAPAPRVSPLSPVLSAPPSGPDSQHASAFSASKLFAIDVDEFAHDPELEEASIRFANGDDEGAEAGLMEVLAPHGTRVNHDETWLTLFDLYRATGRQDRYEAAAIEFAGRFGRSAPQWFSLPEIVGRMSAPAAGPASGGMGNAIADWTSPAIFGTQTLAAMNAALGKASPPLRLNWSKLTSVVESAIEPLTRTFTQWAGQNTQLRFIGAEVLERVLKDSTPSGDRGINPAWWKLRMEVLRVMHRPDEFELVALDYCVTYEVSPPSWDSARCEYKPLQSDGTYAGGHTIIGEAFRDSIASGMTTGYGDTQMPSVMNSQMSNVATVELAGQILGDATEALEMLEAKMVGADVMVVSCSRLMRIDFTAAGTLLNWVTAREAEGRQVQFIEVHRLVAAFFNVIGISEHARVIVRHD